MESTCKNDVQAVGSFDCNDDVFRPLAHFPEDIWGDRFLETGDCHMQIDVYREKIDQLKKQVGFMLVDDSVDHKDKLYLINIVERLGISYHFEEVIEEELQHIFEKYNYENNYDLFTIGVHFRVFRQHGYKISTGVFNKFKDCNGKLDENLRNDVKGILSLYEAAHLRVHNEEFLDEALEEATNVLRSIASGSSKIEDHCLFRQAVHALKQAYHTGVQRVETRHFITFYEAFESRNETLLLFAKLDFNMLQLVHRQELSKIVKWWKDLNVKTQLPYARDRSLECHFWALAMYFEDSYSHARLLMAKVFCIISILDDTYDAYGTKEELTLLTLAFERWDKIASDELPGVMKLVFMHVFDAYNDFEIEMAKDGRPYAARYAKERVLDLIRSYYLEVQWAHDNYIPSFEEYMSNARITSVAQIVTTSAMMGMKADLACEKEFEWVVNPVPRVIRGAEVVGRLMDDIVTHQEEQQRGLHVVSSVECYMNEHGLSRDETVVALWKMIKDGWKDMNEELIRPTPVSPRVISLVFNLMRLVDALYKDVDGYTYSAKVMKDDALAIYVESFIV